MKFEGMEIELKKKFVLGEPTAYKPQVERTKELIETTKKNVNDCAFDVWQTHEWIVTKKGEWAKTTWTQYRKDIGVDPRTPYNWFKKKGWDYTRTRRLDLLAPASKPKAPHLPKETEPEIKPDIENVIKAIKKKGIAQDDLTDLVQTVADNVEGAEASAVLGHAARVHAKSGTLGIRPKRKREVSDIDIMVKSFHHFLALLERVWGTGFKHISKKDRETMDHLTWDFFNHNPDPRPEENPVAWGVTIDESNLVDRISMALNAYRRQKDRMADIMDQMKRIVAKSQEVKKSVTA